MTAESLHSFNRNSKERKLSMRNNGLLKLVLPGLVAVSLGLMATQARASLILLTNSYFQDFNTLAKQGKSTSLPTGWSTKGLVNAGDQYIADDGSDLNGGLKSYGV